MNFMEVIKQIDLFDGEAIVCMQEPWTMNSEVRLARLDEKRRLPSSVTSDGFSYFMGIAHSREILEILAGKDVTNERRGALLIHYASTDTFPDWAYVE